MKVLTRSDVHGRNAIQPGSPGAPKATILLVDDRSTERRLLRTVLGYAGYRLLEATNGEEALKLVRQRRPDLVITDILMPIMDGYELVLAIRRHSEIAATRVIFYSATYRTEEARTLGIAAGAARFITKPTDPEELLSIVETVLRETPHEPKSMPSAAQLERAHFQLVNDKLFGKTEGLEREIAEHRRTQEALEASAMLAGLVADVQTLLSCAPELCPPLQQCAESIVRRLDGAVARIWTLDAGKEVLELQANAGMDGHFDGAQALIAMGKAPIGMIAQERKPHLTNALIGDSRVPDQEWAKGERFIAFAGYPLIVEDRLVGTMGIFSRHRFSEAAFEALAAIGAGVAMGIERKRTNEAMYEQVRLLDLARDAIVVRSFADHKITFWNKGAERLYGWSAEEVIGQSIEGLLCGDEQDVLATDKALLSSDEWRGERKQVSKQGRMLIVNCRATLVRDPIGDATSVLMINTDITEEKALEARFLHAQRMESIGTLASGVAHDLNNILAPILMCAPLLRDDISPKFREEMVSTIESAAERGAGIVKQVLTFARAVEGARVLMQVPPLVTEIVNIAQATFSRNISTSFSYASGLSLIEADPTQFHQVLLNLCVNARDAMPEGGKLTLRAENATMDEQVASMQPNTKAGPYVVLTVTDTGSGIPPHIIDKMFDPFFTTKEIGKGTGLGLSTVAGIVANHRGSIDVESEVGRGTTFKIYFPATKNSAHLGAPSACLKPPLGNGELILVVDDEPSIRKLTASMLQLNGYNVLVASDGAEALALFAAQPDAIKLLLSDLMMPYLDGVGLTRAIRKIRENLPVIVSTGLGEESLLADARAAGARVTLMKPYNTAKLLVAVRDTLAGVSL